jgi:predicted nuclease of predicted toxin-antitoxin system
MTFWLDAQLPPGLAAWLGSHFGVVAKHLSETGLVDETDEVIFQAAGRFPNIVIVTKDVAFANWIKSAGPPPCVVRVACGNMTLVQTQLYFRNRFGAALDALQGGATAAEM